MALTRLNRETTKLDTFFIVLIVQGERDEDEVRELWRAADSVMTANRATLQ